MRRSVPYWKKHSIFSQNFLRSQEWIHKDDTEPGGSSSPTRALRHPLPLE